MSLSKLMYGHLGVGTKAGTNSRGRHIVPVNYKNRTPWWSGVGWVQFTQDTVYCTRVTSTIIPVYNGTKAGPVWALYAFKRKEKTRIRTVYGINFISLKLNLVEALPWAWLEGGTMVLVASTSMAVSWAGPVALESWGDVPGRVAAGLLRGLVAGFPGTTAKGVPGAQGSGRSMVDFSSVQGPSLVKRTWVFLVLKQILAPKRSPRSNWDQQCRNTLCWYRV